MDSISAESPQMRQWLSKLQAVSPKVGRSFNISSTLTLKLSTLCKPLTNNDLCRSIHF